MADEASAYLQPLDIVRFQALREERIYESLVFGLLSLIKKVFAKKVAFRKGRAAISGQGEVVLKPCRNAAPTNLDSQSATSCTSKRARAAIYHT